MKHFVLLILTICFITSSYSQDRFTPIESKLIEISAITPGLNEKVDFSVVGVSIQEFLRGLAESNNLNISVDPSLDIRVYNNFTNEKVSNILLFLCKEYELDIHFVGSIMSFKKFLAPVIPEKPKTIKEIDIKYLTASSTLTLNLKNDSIQKVVKAITTLTGNNVVLSPEIKSDKPISVYIQNMPFDNAIEKMAFANGLELEKTEDNFYVLKEAPKEIASNNSSNRKPNSSRNRNSSNKQKGNNTDIELEITDSLGIKYISFSAYDSPISDAIKYVCDEIDVNYFLFSDPTGNTTAQLSTVTFDEFLNFILHGTKHTFKFENDIYLIGERNLEGLRKTKVITLQYRSFEDVMAVIPNDLKNGVQINEFKELNSFVLSGSAPQIAEIESFIYDIDKIVPLIMIEVIMVDIKRGHTVSTGLEAGIHKKGDPDPIPEGGGTLIQSIDYVLSSKSINSMTAPFNLGKVDKNFYLSLKALEENNIAQIRSMPKLSTLNSHEATLSIGTTTYYTVISTSTTNSLSSPIVNNNVKAEPAEANLEINITPIVSGDNHVTLTINISNSTFTTTAKENTPPDTQNSSFSSMIRVHDNDMVILGGMEQIEKRESGTGVPILSRIPIIKWFFSNKVKSKNKSISVVFIKPSIIY